MEQGPIELGSGLVGGQVGGQAAESDLTGGEVAAIRLCLLGFGSLCATLAKDLFTLELNNIQKLKTRKISLPPPLNSHLRAVRHRPVRDGRSRAACFDPQAVSMHVILVFWSPRFRSVSDRAEKYVHKKGKQILFVRRTPF